MARAHLLLGESSLFSQGLHLLPGDVLRLPVPVQQLLGLLGRVALPLDPGPVALLPLAPLGRREGRSGSPDLLELAVEDQLVEESRHGRWGRRRRTLRRRRWRRRATSGQGRGCEPKPLRLLEAEQEPEVVGHVGASVVPDLKVWNKKSKYSLLIA